MIRIIDYEAGNLTSVKRALDFLGIPSEITPDAHAVASAERVIFPGVGNAASAMKTLKARGLDAALREACAKGTPIMGICLGTQIVLERSEEEDTPCVGLLAGTTLRFRLKNRALKIPHMGWDSLALRKAHPILMDVRPNDEFYFVHSFYPQPAHEEMVLAACEYEVAFPAAIGFRNIFATQFHPEKSGPAGLRILRNFAAWDGSAC